MRQLILVLLYMLCIGSKTGAPVVIALIELHRLEQHGVGLRCVGPDLLLAKAEKPMLLLGLPLLLLPVLLLKALVQVLLGLKPLMIKFHKVFRLLVLLGEP